MYYLKNNFIYKIIIFLIFNFFIFGFFIKEDAAGGGENDFIFHIYNNIILFKNYNFLDIPWSSYDSSSLPLYYLITKYLIPSKNPFVYKLFTFFLSLSCVLIFYKILKKKYNELQNHNHIFFLIAATPLLSPYFRTSAFWGIEENIAYFFFLLTGYFYFRDLKKYFNQFLLIFFASVTFYGRQNYAFLSIIIFLNLFNFKEICTKRNIYIILYFIVFLLPSLYFFLKWNGLMVKSTNPRPIAFNLFNIPIILSIFFFYYIPLIVINFQFYLKKIISVNKLIILIILFFIFFIIFKQNPDVLFSQKLGSGLIYKLIFNFGLFNNYKNFAMVLFLFISYLGLVFSMLFCRKNFQYLIYFLVSLSLFSFVNIIFQEYFDPLIFFVIFIFGNFFKNNQIIKICNYYLIFYSLLIISTLFYRNYI
jgi:hypothetical protein